jgi:Asp-tRNA(Asn)/Glu-tRNA(Gln) amidotransferase A subunit family amidase
VPLATGSQTAGSVNRPASYCGVLGYKPSFGLFAREGMKPLAPSLDTAGLFGRSVRDLALAAGVLGLPDGVALLDAPPRIAFARTGLWSRVETDAQRAILSLGIEEVELPGYEELADAHKTIQFYESAVSLAPELARAPELLSDELRAALEEGAAISAVDYQVARRVAAERGPAVASVLGRYDGLLTPSATGVPPLGLEFTGDPLFCRVWTLIGAPAVSIPLAWTEERLPVGLQVVGAPGADRTVLAAAEWLTRAG